MKKSLIKLRVAALLLLGVLALGSGANAQVNMSNGSGTLCSGFFYDSGGPSGNYSNGEDLVYTLTPTPGTVVQAIFSSLAVETCCDNLKIYNGNSTAATLIGTYTANPGTITSTAPDGSLTFQFHSDGSVNNTGFAAYVSCVSPCAGTPAPGNTVSTNANPCSGINFDLYLQNGASLNSTYQWQSSTDGVTFNNVPAGGTGPTYSTSQTAATYYQCIVTCTTSGSSTTSTPVQVGVGTCVSMVNGGSTTTCSGTFFDSGGGGGNYGNGEDMVYTIYPQPGNFLRAIFSFLSVETCCDNLKIYNGNSTAAPLIGTYTSNPGNILSSAADGSLTFQFHSDGSVNNPGWEAALSCVPNPPCAGQPNPGTATASASTVCPGVNFTINVQTPLQGSGVAYQWQSSPDGFAWTNVPGQTTTVFSGSQAQALSYRLRAICLAGPDTGYSGVAAVALTPFMNCYCTSVSNSTADEDITNVTFAGINNTSSTNNCQTYNDYSAVTGIAFKGLTYDISVNTADCENVNFYSRKVSVFVDWNQNGLFTDPGELVFDPANAPAAATVLFNGNVTIPTTAVSGITKMRVIVVEGATSIAPCGGYGFGETEDYSLNVLDPPTDEAGVLAITKPEIAACDLGNKIWVNLQNLGTNPLESATFIVKVNGLNLNPPVWNGNVPPQSTAEIMLPVDYTLSDGDSIYVEVSLPNGQTESPLLAFNNIVTRRVYAGLSGVKTVYGTGPDFATVDAAIQALQFRGVCDTVYFKIASGTYTTQHTFVPYVGAGPGKLAVFESATGNAADVTFSFGAATANNNFVFRFDGGDRYMLRNLTAKNAGTSFSSVVDIRNNANDLTFEGNTFVGDTAVAYNTSDFNSIVVVSAAGSGTKDDRTVLRNNHIIGGNRGVNLGGESTGYETGNVLEGNTIEKYAYIGAILGNVSDYTVNGNVFRGRTNLTQEVFGIYATTTIDGAKIGGNDILTNRTGSGIYLNNVKGGSSDVYVTNNFVYQGDTAAATPSRGIFVLDANSSDIVLANNSVSIGSDNNTSAGISVADGSQIRLFNNNVGAFGNSPALRVEKQYSVSQSNYNNFFGATVANYVGVAAATLAELQAANGKDSSSKNVNPGFNGTDLHTCAAALNAAGLPLAQVTADFDGDTRSATPDIGADEFLGDNNDLLAEDTFLKCPAEEVTIGNPPMNGVTYSWSPAAGTSQITTANAGTYILTANSACGSFTATATVTNKPLPTASFTSTTVGLAAVFANTSTNGTTYLWNFGDGQTSTQVNPSHVYEQAGTYSVSLTVTNECGSVTFGPQPVNVINAGIDEQSTVNVNLFPNPTDGQFNISLNGTTDAVTVNVVDVTGKVVALKNVAAGVNQITLDATPFASGVYSVKISDGTFTRVLRLVRK